MKLPHKIQERPFLLFLPFLFLYLAYVLLKPTHGNEADEGRYLLFVQHLMQGFYSPQAPNINLWNGPGYPLFILPIIASGLPLIAVTIANAVMHYLSVVFLYKSLRRWVRFPLALACSIFWACYLNAFQNMPLVATETFTMLLITLLLYFLVQVWARPAPSADFTGLLPAGFVLGYIVLTKIIFGYVLLFLLFFGLAASVFARKNIHYRIIRNLAIVAMLVNIPYLMYTYGLTGKLFYWGNSGGQSLYWMSTPYSDEYGDWKGPLVRGTVDMGNFNIPGSEDSLQARHGADYAYIYSLPVSEQDDAFKKLAVENIKKHPGKYATNVVYNAGRLFFHYPFSYAVQRPKTLFVIPLNAILFALLLFSLYHSLGKFFRLSVLLQFIITIVLLYIGLSLLVSAYTRMFTVIVPLMLFWFAWVIRDYREQKAA